MGWGLCAPQQVYAGASLRLSVFWTNRRTCKEWMGTVPPAQWAASHQPAAPLCSACPAVSLCPPLCCFCLWGACGGADRSQHVWGFLCFPLTHPAHSFPAAGESLSQVTSCGEGVWNGPLPQEAPNQGAEFGGRRKRERGDKLSDRSQNVLERQRGQDHF